MSYTVISGSAPPSAPHGLALLIEFTMSVDHTLLLIYVLLSQYRLYHMLSLCKLQGSFTGFKLASQFWRALIPPTRMSSSWFKLLFQQFVVARDERKSGSTKGVSYSPQKDTRESISMKMFLCHLEVCASEKLTSKEKNTAAPNAAVPSPASAAVTGLMAFSLVHLFYLNTVRSMRRHSLTKSYYSSYEIVFKTEIMDEGSMKTSDVLDVPSNDKEIIHIESLDLHSLGSTFGRYLNLIQCDCLVLAADQTGQMQVVSPQLNADLISQKSHSESCVSTFEGQSTNTTKEDAAILLSAIVEKAGMTGLSLSEAKARFRKHLCDMETDVVVDALFEYSLITLTCDPNPSIIRLSGPTRMTAHMNSEFTKQTTFSWRTCITWYTTNIATCILLMARI